MVIVGKTGEFLLVVGRLGCSCLFLCETELK